MLASPMFPLTVFLGSDFVLIIIANRIMTPGKAYIQYEVQLLNQVASKTGYEIFPEQLIEADLIGYRKTLICIIH